MSSKVEGGSSSDLGRVKISKISFAAKKILYSHYFYKDMLKDYLKLTITNTINNYEPTEM